MVGFNQCGDMLEPRKKSKQIGLLQLMQIGVQSGSKLKFYFACIYPSDWCEQFIYFHAMPFYYPSKSDTVLLPK